MSALAARPPLFFVTPQFGRGKGGLGVSAERVARHLAGRFTVRVFELTDDLPLLTYEERADAVLGRTRISSVGERRLVHQLVSDRVLAVAARTPPALLAGFYAAELAYALHLTARLLDRPYLLFARGNDVDLEPFGDAGPRVFFAIEHAQRVFCVSRELEHKLSRWAPAARTVYVPNGVDADEFPCAPRPPAGERVRVGIFGDLKSKKALPLLLGALDFERHALSIVGTLRSDGEKLLHGFCTIHPERAQHVSHAPFAESVAAMRAAYAGVDVVCVPSTHEGMSNVMLEAMASGAVCVASRVGGAIDVIAEGENGFLFEPGDEDGLRAALDRAGAAARDPAARLTRAARRTVEDRFGVALERRRYLEALAELAPARA